MEYDFQAIEKKWREHWAKNNTFRAEDSSEKPKYYVLDMFPYPSGAGLHVGHPLGYIASDIFSRYKRLKGFNVLHPMGYDSFGLPAEQYAIQTGQHPQITTETNINRYREQLDNIGFSFDWEREIRTSSPEYYKWTQWIFKQIFNSWYNNDSNKAEDISTLISVFEKEGNGSINAVHDCEKTFSAEEWNAFSEKEQSDILMDYRLTYLADSWVNWCPALGTVLANDEVVNGVSERGGHPVEQKLMRQWSMRIKAYAERLLTDLDGLDWTDSIKDIQRNWIGKSQGAEVSFEVEGIEEKIKVFTTRPDTIFGVSFLTLAPEHELVAKITTDEYREKIEAYQQQASLKSERDRQSDVKNITGQFTGAYAIHPFSGEKVQIWIGDYVLASYGTGAVMAVPSGDQRDWDFATHFGIEIKNVFENVDISEQAYTEKSGMITNSDFLDGLPIKKAIKRAIHEIETRQIGEGQTNYRLRDAVFSRQRYWGEPFPVYYENEIPKLIEDDFMPIVLPEVDKYLPTEDGAPPLGNATTWSWCRNKKIIKDNDKQNGVCTWPMELNTMPGWAGSSWYFLRYLDPKNENEFASKEKIDYWNNVDLYIGGSEHATGHLLYARFWTKFLYDRGFISFTEPFQKMINQGMILGKSAIAFVRKSDETMVSFDNIDENEDYRQVKIWIDLINDDESIKIEELKEWQPQFKEMNYAPNSDGKIIVKREVDKMSKRWFNVVNPDDLCQDYGADTLRMYEMFLGPLEQAKPWDTKGINGVHNFLRKLWKLYCDRDGNLIVTEGEADKKALKSLHKTIKKIEDDLERFSFNTGVSNFMICVNELTEQKCHNKAVLTDLLILLSPYAPHIAEELWEKLGNEAGSISYAKFPKFNPDFLVEATHAYPVSFNGKMRFKLELDNGLSKEEIEKEVLAHELSAKWLDGNNPKKVIVVPGKIVNVVL